MNKTTDASGFNLATYKDQINNKSGVKFTRTKRNIKHTQKKNLKSPLKFVIINES